MTVWLLMTVLAIVVKLVVDECFDWLPWLSRKILHTAALHLPKEHRPRYEEEWLAELEAVPGRRLARLLFSVGVLSSASATRKAIDPAMGLYFSTPGKRLVDLLTASLTLALLLPMFAVIALVIRVSSPGPAFSTERCIGFEGVPFELIRFRTAATSLGRSSVPMAPEDSTRTNSNDTPLGRCLRRYSLDELPQIINVLKGDMSLIGPRPLRAEEAAHLEDWQLARHSVRPGVSGLWQVDGRRHNLSFDAMVRLDLLYAERWSLRRDIEILVRTVVASLTLTKH